MLEGKCGLGVENPLHLRAPGLPLAKRPFCLAFVWYGNLVVPDSVRKDGEELN